MSEDQQAHSTSPRTVRIDSRDNVILTEQTRDVVHPARESRGRSISDISASSRSIPRSRSPRSRGESVPSLFDLPTSLSDDIALPAFAAGQHGADPSNLADESSSDDVVTDINKGYRATKETGNSERQQQYQRMMLLRQILEHEEEEEEEGDDSMHPRTSSARSWGHVDGSYTGNEEEEPLFFRSRSLRRSHASRRSHMENVGGTGILAFHYDHLVELAAAYYRNGFFGRTLHFSPKRRSLKAMKILDSYLYNICKEFMIFLYLCIALFERPHRDGPVLGEYTYLVELGFLVLLAADTGAKRFCVPRHRFLNNRLTQINMCVLSVSFVSTLLSKFVHWDFIYGARILRSWFMITSDAGLRVFFFNMLAMIPGALPTLALLVLHVSFGFLMATQFFAGTAQEDYLFTSIWGGFEKLINTLLLTNTPDVMLKTLNDGDPRVLFFILYIFVGNIVLLNILLASIYTTYRSLLQVSSQEAFVHSTRASQYAYKTLDFAAVSIGEPGVTWNVIKDFLWQLDVKNDIAELMFAMLDLDQSGMVTMDEFHNLTYILSMKVTTAPRKTQTWLARNYPKIHGLFTGNSVRRFFDFLILLNAVTIVMQILDSLQDYSIAYAQKLEFINEIYVYISVFEIALNVFAQGWRSYFRTRWARADAIGVTILFFSAVITQNARSVVTRTAMLFRILRLMRPLSMVNAFRETVKATLEVLSSVYKIFGLAILVYYVYAQLGMLIYGNVMKQDDPDVLETCYAENGYWSLTFDTFLSSMCILFFVMITNNYFCFMDGFIAASKTQWTAVYFLSWYVVITLMTLNVLVAFVIETFQEKMSSSDRTYVVLITKYKDDTGRTRHFVTYKSRPEGIEHGKWVDQAYSEHDIRVRNNMQTLIERHQEHPEYGRDIEPETKAFKVAKGNSFEFLMHSMLAGGVKLHSNERNTRSPNVRRQRNGESMNH
eukprot:Clim_evm47s146 gene=Clim_evmTU47s146